MKMLKLFISLVALIMLSVESYGQDKYTIRENNIELKDLLEKLKIMSDYTFFFSNDHIDISTKVSVDVHDKNISEIMTQALMGTGIIFHVKGKNITLSLANKKNSTNKTEPPPEKEQLQQDKSISGTVLDEKGEPAIGSSVQVKNTTIGTTADLDGNFTLSVPPQSTLVVSYLGYTTREVEVGNQTRFQITLRENVKFLDEVVVVGYGTVKKSDFTGAISSMSAKQFKDQPIMRTQDALQGRVAGVDVTNLNGRPDSDMRIRIRGITSINKSNEPLVIIDGFSGGMSTVNPADIQSIEILKDASSTAVYGSRGANGVVLITTKRGETGKAQISFQSENGWGKVYNTYNMLSPYEFALALNATQGYLDGISPDDLENYKNGTKGVDWWNLMMQTAVNQNYKLQISGGNANNSYLLSGNVIDQTSNVIRGHFGKQMFRANIDSKVSDWLHVKSDLSTIFTQKHNFDDAIYMLGVMNYNRAMELKDPVSGVYNPDNINMKALISPYGNLVGTDRDVYTTNLRGNLNFTFFIADGLTFSVMGALANYFSKTFGFFSATRSPSSNNNSSNSDYYSFNWQNTNNLTYDKTIGPHHFTLTGVAEFMRTEDNSLTATAQNLQNPATVGYWNLSDGLTRDAENSYSASSLVSYFGRINYVYNKKYMLTATLRADASSKFQGKNKWGYFPSGAIAWNAAEEDFIKDRNFFDQLKLRTSAGITGNQAIDPYSTLGMLARTNYSYNTDNKVTTYWAASSPTPGLRWESTTQYDVGLDVSIFGQRLNVSLDYYLKHTKDLLFQKSLPNYMGGGSFWTNAGKLDNTGVELVMDAYPVRGNNKFSWETILTATWQKNKVIDLAGLDYLPGSSPDAGTTGQYDPVSRLVVGKPVGSFWLRRYYGLNEEGYREFWNANGELVSNPTDEDKVIKGNANPAYVFGWNNIFSYGNWEANILITSSIDVWRQNILRAQMSYSTVPSYHEAYYQSYDYLKANGGNTSNAVFATRSINDAYPVTKNNDSDQWLENAGYVRLKNISISYSIPRKWLQAVNAKLTLSAQNLVTLTKYKGLDPETMIVQGGNNVDLNSGQDFGALPLPKTITVGVKIDF